MHEIRRMDSVRRLRRRAALAPAFASPQARLVASKSEAASCNVGIRRRIFECACVTVAEQDSSAQESSAVGKVDLRWEGLAFEEKFSLGGISGGRKISRSPARPDRRVFRQWHRPLRALPPRRSPSRRQPRGRRWLALPRCRGCGRRSSMRAADRVPAR